MLTTGRFGTAKRLKDSAVCRNGWGVGWCNVPNSSIIKYNLSYFLKVK